MANPKNKHGFKAEDRTSILVHKPTIKKLKRLMKVGDTMEDVIIKLLKKK